MILEKLNTSPFYLVKQNLLCLILKSIKSVSMQGLQGFRASV